MTSRVFVITVVVTLVVFGGLVGVASAEPDWVADRYDSDGDGIDEEDLRRAAGDVVAGDASVREMQLLLASRDGVVAPAVRTEYFVHRYVNEERTTRGISAVTWDGHIMSVARGHSDDMAARDFFDHVNPDGDDWADRLEAGGHCYLPSSENLFLKRWSDGHDWRDLYDGPRDLARDLVDGWMSSEAHRENILESFQGADWSTTGVGITIESEQEKIYATQKFAGCSETEPSVDIQETSEDGAFTISVNDAAAVMLTDLPAAMTVTSASGPDSAVTPENAGDLVSSHNAAVWVTEHPRSDTYSVDFNTSGLATDGPYSFTVEVQNDGADTASTSTSFTVSTTHGDTDDPIERYDTDGDGIGLVELQTAIQDYLANDLDLQGIQAIIQNYLSS